MALDRIVDPAIIVVVVVGVTITGVDGDDFTGVKGVDVAFVFEFFGDAADWSSD